MRPKASSRLSPAKIHFIEPMYARLLNELPEGHEWLYEVKFDGYRCLAAGRDSTGVTLWSRKGNQLNGGLIVGFVKPRYLAGRLTVWKP